MSSLIEFLHKKKIKIIWLGWDGDGGLFYRGTRFNSGCPYKFWRFGPIMIMNYL
jgi:hypothetical protein